MSNKKYKDVSSSKDPPCNKSFEDTPYDGQTYYSQVYRNSNCGEMLKETINDFLKQGKINHTVAQSLMLQYDESIQKQLKTQLNNTIRFCGHLHTYRSYNDVWTLLFKDILFTEGDDQVMAPCIKFVCQQCPDKDNKKKKRRKRKISSDNE